MELHSNYSFNPLKCTKLDGLEDSFPMDADQLVTLLTLYRPLLRTGSLNLHHLLLHCGSMYSVPKGTNIQYFLCSWLQIAKTKICFPLLPVSLLFLPQFFSFMEFERYPGNCVKSLQHNH